MFAMIHFESDRIGTLEKDPIDKLSNIRYHILYGIMLHFL